MTSGLLPRALLDPAAYPHRPESVTVKKPVTFPFVDYGTLARRREFCEEEVRRSRRFARDIYLGVVAIVARGDDGVRERENISRGESGLIAAEGRELRAVQN